MATAQDYLQSIAISLADLQRVSPEMLVLVTKELQMIDYALGAIRDRIVEGT